MSKICKTTIIFLSFLLLLLFSPSKADAQELSITFYLSGDGLQTLYMPAPSKIKKVNVLACAEQNRNGGFQLGIALLFEGAQVAYQETLFYARSGCPMWASGGTADGTAFDFGGTSADAVQIVALLGAGTYYNMYVTYEEGYVPPVVQCGSGNTIAKYAGYSRNYVLPEGDVKIHIVNAYACSVQNRDGGFRLAVNLLNDGASVAFRGSFWDCLAYARSGCPMWSGGRPPSWGLNFGGVVADTIDIYPFWGGGAIYNIYYTHEPPECTYAAIAVASISKDGINYGTSIVSEGVSTPVYLSAAGSYDPNSWDDIANGGYCEWNTDFNTGTPTFERKIMNPPTPEACNIYAGEKNFGTSAGTYSYGVLRIVDKDGTASEVASVSVVVPPNQPPSAVNLSATQPDYCTVAWPAAILSWTFTDPDVGDAQSAYRIQVDNNSDFSSLVIDTSKVLSSSQSYATLSGFLGFNTTYYWRVKVWDSKVPNLESAWVTGPSFTTPLHAFINIGLTPSLSKPTAGEIITLIDSSKCYSAPINAEYDCKNGALTQYAWDFDYDSSAGFTTDSTIKGNATTSYAAAGTYNIALRITDDICVCTKIFSIGIGLALPKWIEIPPY